MSIRLRSHHPLELLGRCLIAGVLIVAIAFKAKDLASDRLAGLAIGFDLLLIGLLAFATIRRLGDYLAAAGFLAMAAVGATLTLTGSRCGCFGAAEVPPFAPTFFALTAACFCGVCALNDKRILIPRVEWLRYAAPIAVALSTAWLAIGSVKTAAADAEGVRVDLIAHHLSGIPLSETILLEPETAWDEAKVVLFISSSCSTCQKLLAEINRRWSATSERWILLIDLDRRVTQKEQRLAPFIAAAATDLLRLSTPAAARIGIGGCVDDVFVGRPDDVDGIISFMETHAPVAELAQGDVR